MNDRYFAHTIIWTVITTIKRLKYFSLKTNLSYLCSHKSFFVFMQKQNAVK